MSNSLSLNEIVKRARNVHGDRYDYSKVNYIRYDTKIKIKCQQHGEFEQTPANHINNKSGCPKCACVGRPQNTSHTTKRFIQKAKQVHGNVYDYSSVEYKNTHTHVTIICSKHGDFVQRPVKHLGGTNCPKCSFSSKGERTVREILITNDIEFREQKTFVDCVNTKTNKVLKFDFFIPSINTLIEYDGIQHSQPTRFNGISRARATKIFEGTMYRDNIKTNYAHDNNLVLVRITAEKKKDITKQLESYIL